MDEFLNCGKQQELLKQIPVYVITDYNVSLYGAAEYMRLEGLCD
jgi:glucokinase